MGENYPKKEAWIICRFNRGLGKRRSYASEVRGGGGGRGGWDPNVQYKSE